MREQAYRDPVHGFITVNQPVIQKLIDTPEFQRLRRIRQLGAAYGTYHGAEHSRFGHSVGAYWIMQCVLERLVNSGWRISDDVWLIATCAALLHDVGHGPFSHALEGKITLGVGHEEWSRAVLLGDTEINAVLTSADPGLSAQIAAVLEGTYSGPEFVRELVSSQLDVDRMDYLLRDSLYTGVTYGRFDLHRVINTLQLLDNRVVVQAKGIVAIEEYVLARYFMYWQVYFHKATRSHELLLRKVWQRATYLWQKGQLQAGDVTPSLAPLVSGKPVDLPTYLMVDDYDVVASMKMWRRHTDAILADLASRYLDRRLLKPLFKTPHTGPIGDRLDEAREIVRRNGWDPEYYLVLDHTRDLAYDTYTEEAAAGEHKPPILALDERANAVEIAKLSETIRALGAKPREAVNIYVPQDVVQDVRNLFIAPQG